MDADNVAARGAILADPHLSIPEKMLRLGSHYQEPSAEDYALLVSLTERIIEGYLEAAVAIWLVSQRETDARLKNKDPRLAAITAFDDDRVHIEYYADADDARERVTGFLSIPVADLLPEYGSRRATLRALSG